jgi:hypothetical protein
MSFIAAAFWLMTAVGGIYMLSRTITGSRNAAGETVSDLPVMPSFLHPTLALVGLALLGAYVFTLEPWFAWLALADLLLAAAGGGLLFGKWLKGRRASSGLVRRFPAEQTIPAEVVVVHGVLAAATILLFLVVAIRA